MSPTAVDTTPLLPGSAEFIPDTKPEEILPIYTSLTSAFRTDRTKSLEWRLGQLDALERMIRENGALFKQAMLEDMHVSPLDSDVMQVSLALSDIELFKANLESWMKPETVSSNLLTFPGKSELLSEPLGVVVVYGAWNYNFLLTLQPVIGAIGAGNCVLMKPGDYAVRSTQAMMQLIPRYMDQDCIRVVSGGPELSDAILEHEWQKIFFTGSPNVGRIIYEKAAKFLTPCTLELGGKSPCIVDGTADLTVTARRLVWGALASAGQTCVRPDYVLVHESIGDRLVQMVKSTVKEFYGEDPKESPWFARVINQRNFDRVTGLFDGSEDLMVLGGPKTMDRDTCYVPPTIINFRTDKQRFAAAKVMQMEIFGPVIPVCYYNDVSECVDFIRSRPSPLASYLFSSDPTMKETFKHSIHSGSQAINDTMVQLSVEDLPFGGTGASGFGSYHGKYSFECFSHKKAVLSRPTILDVPQRYPPYTPADGKFLRAALNAKLSLVWGRLSRLMTTGKIVAFVVLLLAHLSELIVADFMSDFWSIGRDSAKYQSEHSGPNSCFQWEVQTLLSQQCHNEVDDYYENEKDDNYRRSMILCFGMATQKYRRCKEEGHGGHWWLVTGERSQARANTLEGCLLKHFKQAITLLLKTAEVNGKCVPIQRS
ncbi:Eukaryotic translation initiation factor 5A-1 [Perkinsus olseni]|uniref:Eukaryotic translation initiation factor 5A-1 n=3 Tax=Perkinsus olseni TaxID=32597 RepID=A0A7J6PPT5_PEROL|nr:Eukaryotic translation initiation factor 5A-1 [Perkinsus olseni]